MTLVLVWVLTAFNSKVSVRRIEETNVAAFKTIRSYHGNCLLNNYLAISVPLSSLNKHCTKIS